MTSYKTNWKKDRVKRLIKNWRPITLLNVDSKLISKYLANRLQDVMPSLVRESQSAFVNNIFISEGKVIFGYPRNYRFTSERRTFNDNWHKKKAFDFAKQFFLISALKW